MREILFRGKRFETQDWIEGDLLIDGCRDVSIRENHCTMYFDIIPETIGEYTGLTDKNGKKIFEGDIIQGKVFGDIWKGEIVWIDEIAAFGVRYFHRSDPTAWENSSILKAAKYKKDIFAAEIIGNIYDNPELLRTHNGRFYGLYQRGLSILYFSGSWLAAAVLNAAVTF